MDRNDVKTIANKTILMFSRMKIMNTILHLHPISHRLNPTMSQLSYLFVAALACNGLLIKLFLLLTAVVLTISIALIETHLLQLIFKSHLMVQDLFQLSLTSSPSPSTSKEKLPKIIGSMVIECFWRIRQ